MIKEPSYDLPPQIALALSTDRPEFVKMLRGAIERGEQLSQEALLNILHLVEDMIRDRVDIRQRENEITHRLGLIDDMGAGILKKVHEIEEVMRGNAVAPSAVTPEERLRQTGVLLIGDSVVIKHNDKLDGRYEESARAARAQCNGQRGAIRDSSDSHGACFKVFTPVGTAWYEPEELEHA